MSSIYWNILSGVQNIVQALPGFALSAFPKTTFTIRRKPAFVKEQDGPQQCVIAPNEDLAEKVDALTFANTVFLVFDVYIGLGVFARWDTTLLQWRLDRREDIRLALWNPTVLQNLTGLTGEFDVDYEPKPGVSDEADKTKNTSWQLFSFKVSTTRQKP